MFASLRILSVVIIGVVVSVSRAAEPKHGEFASESIMVDKLKREYRLVVPKTVDLKKPAPLVFAFHGFLIDSKDAMPVYSKLNDTAAKHRFILVYPNATDRIWAFTPEQQVRDVAYFDALLEKLQTDYKIDPERIYLTGMSNGGYMAHFVGKERSKVIAAVACHSGALGLQTLLGIGAARKFPVMIVHGDKDNIIAVDIARENRDKYKKEGHEVNYVEIKGLTHWWGSDHDVNEKIWKFFAEHPRNKK